MRKEKKAQKAIIENKKVVDSLTDLFRVLKEANAIVGRDDQRIVLDKRKLPEILNEKSTMEFMSYRLTATGFGIRSIFQSVETDENFILLNIEGFLKREERFETGFPFLDEARAVILSVELMSIEQSQASDLLHEEVSDLVDKVFREKGPEIIRSLFFGEGEGEPIEVTPKTLH
jgi:hypothetical protein